MNVKVSGELRHEFQSKRAKLTRGGGDHIEFRFGLLRKNDTESYNFGGVSGPP
jgi:hypothetical protein